MDYIRVANELLELAKRLENCGQGSTGREFQRGITLLKYRLLELEESLQTCLDVLP